MTEPWTAKQRDQILSRVSRATVLSGAVALVATAGISYGLAGATSSATLASGSTPTSSSAPSTTTAQSTTSQASSVQSSSTGTVSGVSTSVGAPVATSGGS